ncbi:CLUMA_CG015108, isoform A [Clunio marinus]|uniref:Cytochrome b5-related protein n=1 Tax=Clunio marinus TaxID=568069 RepID=A0A1J1IRH5_9DIPT|nr:CLUMA_CG015108, isoform A [Clunio marinus]
MEVSAKIKDVTIVRKYPAFRDKFVNGCWRWIEGKRKDDFSEGLWRIHNNLYDLTDFIIKHPGGKYWLEVTQGTDITEAFESHHLSTKPEKLLPKYFVREAKYPRNYFLTYDENGFYRTLKKRVEEKLKSIDKSVTWKSRWVHDINLFVLFVSAIMANRTENKFLHKLWIVIAAQCFAWCAMFSHNFFHQADNWRMYTSNISLVSWRDYRVFHILSHHMYTNSFSDFETSTFEPYLKWIPTLERTWCYYLRLIAFIPLLILSFFHNFWRYRFQGYIWGNEKVFRWDDFLLFTLPLAQILFGKKMVTLSYLEEIYWGWASIAIPGSILYSIIFFNRGHHAPYITHQNDEIKSLDFGEYQLSTTIDRKEANYNIFTSLAYFGDQTLHHLFPTIDHAILPELRNILIKTCKEFDVDLHPETSMIRSTIDQYKQLLRTKIIRCS